MDFRSVVGFLLRECSTLFFMERGIEWNKPAFTGSRTFQQGRCPKRQKCLGEKFIVCFEKEREGL